MKKMLCVLIALSIAALLFSFVATGSMATDPIRVASLKGPTSMGLVQMMNDASVKGDYAFTVSGTPDEIVPLLAKGELDIALVPCNLAGVLYNKTDGSISIAAINTLGVLYVVENGDTIHEISNLKGKTLYSTGKGTTPEYVFNTVLTQNNIDPNTDLTIEYKSEATEVASALTAGQITLAMLPQPFATAVQAQIPGLRVALSLTDEWVKVLPESALVTGVVLMRKDFIQNRPDSVSRFMENYRASTQYVNENPAEAAQWIEALGISKAAIAEQAIPLCNIVCIEGADMQSSVSGYLSALFAQDPASIGGALPNEDFYYHAG